MKLKRNQKSNYTFYKVAHFTSYFVLCITVLSCEVQGELTTAKASTGSVSQAATISYIGNFSPTSGILVTGSAKIFSDAGVNKLLLENFSISSGPDLKVYLSKSNSPTQFVNLGNLNPTTIYTIPAQVNLTEYKFVLIHCQQYNHLFAIAQLN